MLLNSSTIKALFSTHLKVWCQSASLWLLRSELCSSALLRPFWRVRFSMERTNKVPPATAISKTRTSRTCLVLSRMLFWWFRLRWLSQAHQFKAANKQDDLSMWDLDDVPATAALPSSIGFDLFGDSTKSVTISHSVNVSAICRASLEFAPVQSNNAEDYAERCKGHEPSPIVFTHPCFGR